MRAIIATGHVELPVGPVRHRDSWSEARHQIVSPIPPPSATPPAPRPAPVTEAPARPPRQRRSEAQPGGQERARAALREATDRRRDLTRTERAAMAPTIRAAYEAGRPLAGIAAEHGISIAVLRKIRYQFGIPRRQATVDADEVRRLVAGGLSIAEAARQMGVSEAAVSYHLDDRVCSHGKPSRSCKQAH